MTLSFDSYPSPWYAEVLTNNTKFNNVINAYFTELKIPFINYTDNFAELKNSIAYIRVFYDDLSYTLVDETEAVTIVTLIGTLGGNLGLFLGI
jgi:hypothetical protein